MSALRLSISTIESTNFGDHAERLRTDHEHVEGETVEDLVRRVFPKLGPYRLADASDVVEIRVLVDREGKVTGQQEAGEPPW